ncbi:alanine--tRNA ligase [Methylophilaceae bacterium]|jgi:alanyl-tRNA synthetase|nr:alanine--tRNA ligase [Methylophilaceae bacterium]
MTTKKQIITTEEIRSLFLNFFKNKGHKVVASSSLIPHGDATLLFTNAGMNQFKDVFLGIENQKYKTATSSQKCVRAGGKHNDLENVGYTARHHTFFEMLGNFSFGDYFKKEAILYAWELLTKIYRVPEDRLLVTVYKDDQETYDIWSKIIGLSNKKIIRIGDNKGSKYASDNFWMMGDTGPCGPCTEIFYDHGDLIPGGPPGSKDEEGDRYIEIWNLVFMQYNREESGVMKDLPKPAVDTGMGLERITAVLQNVHSNYEIDLFRALIDKAMEVTKVKDEEHPSLKVLADHIRAATFLISDGVMPANEGRGYVLRRIIRRAIRHGYKLGCRSVFFSKMVPTLIELMKSAYPINDAKTKKIMSEIKLEEERFFETIENGMIILENSIKNIASEKKKILPGILAFKLHDTFGFPLDLTADVCREHNLTVNEKEFEIEMENQKKRAREAGKFTNKLVLDYAGKDTIFIGYEQNQAEVRIEGIFKGNIPSKTLIEGDEGTVILNQTPFYAESGGQVGDIGIIEGNNSEFIVRDTYKIKGNIFGHTGYVKSGSLNLKDKGSATINIAHRSNIKRNHSATHLLHKALKIVLGDHVEQKGSLVDSVKTRFDFSHNKALTSSEIKEVELIVNSEILQNQSTQTRLMKIEEAQKEGAMMLFGEKYDEKVRVLNIGNSSELCGGTHVSQTGDIGLFKIQSEIGVASGVRRIEATTGYNLIEIMEQQESILEKLALELKTGTEDIPNKLNQLLSQTKENEKIIYDLKSKIASNEGDELTTKVINIKNYSFLAEVIDNQDTNQLREMIDKLKNILKSAVIILCTVTEDKISFAIGVTDDLTNSIDAGAIAKMLGEKVGGKGGGRKNMAMAGGTKINKIPEAMNLIKENLKK